jgi:uncharacterized protein with HEPN domain
VTGDRINDQLIRMHSCCEHILAFTAGLSFQEFAEDLRTQQAVIMNILLIGEVATKLVQKFPEITTTYPDIPWNNIRGMRNRIAHEYFDLDLNVIWKTIHTAIPDLKTHLQNLI